MSILDFTISLDDAVADLRDRSVLTEDEFQREKRRILK